MEDNRDSCVQLYSLQLKGQKHKSFWTELFHRTDSPGTDQIRVIIFYISLKFAETFEFEACSTCLANLHSFVQRN